MIIHQPDMDPMPDESLCKTPTPFPCRKPCSSSCVKNHFAGNWRSLALVIFSELIYWPSVTSLILALSQSDCIQVKTTGSNKQIVTLFQGCGFFLSPWSSGPIFSPSSYSKKRRELGNKVCIQLKTFGK